MFEVCGHRYADLSEGDYGIALLNDSKYGYSCTGSTLCLSLLRSPKSPDPDCDMGTHSFRYGIYPHLGGTIHNGKVSRAAASFNANNLCFHLDKCVQEEPILDSNCISRDILLAGFARVVPDGCGLIVDVLKVSEDEAAIVLRVAEVEGTRGVATISLAFPDIFSAKLINLNEEGLAAGTENLLFSWRDSNVFNLRISYRPFEIVCVRLE